MRAIGHEKRVVMIQWYKERRWPIGEHELSKMLKGPLFKIYPMGQGFYKLPTDHATPKEHLKAAQEALHLAKELLKDRRASETIVSRVGQRSQSLHQASVQPGLNEAPSSGTFGSLSVLSDGASVPSKQDRLAAPPLFLLVLDEVINAVNDGLLVLPDLLALLELRGSTHLILTGRGAPKELVDIADLVTEMKNVKHPYEEGRKAVLGLDF